MAIAILRASTTPGTLRDDPFLPVAADGIDIADGQLNSTGDRAGRSSSYFLASTFLQG
jgi:hypothetical protein